LALKKIAGMGKDRIDAFVALSGRRRDLDDPGPEREGIRKFAEPFMELRHADKRHEIKPVEIKRAAKAGAFALIITHFALCPCKVEPERPRAGISSRSARVIVCSRLRVA
jgi:hypothetical protein